MEDIETIARVFVLIMNALLDRPEEMIFKISPNETGAIFFVQVPKAQVGLLIGKQGRTAQCLRVLLSGMSMKVQQKISLDIAETAEVTDGGHLVGNAPRT